MTPSFFSLYLYLKKRLQENFEDHLAEQYTWNILSHIFSASKTSLIAAPPKFTNIHTQRIEHILNEVMILKKPVAYVIGSVPFLDLTLDIMPPVLIPRPETEQLVSDMITLLKPYAHQTISILDIGTGSGCIALSLAHHFPHFVITATDISDAALSLATQNAKKNNILNVNIIKSDLFFGIKKTDFDLIISNPPYIAKSEFDFLDQSVKNWEDINALVADDDGFSLLYQIIIGAPKYTNKQSILRGKAPQLVTEIGQTQGKKVTKMMQHAGYNHVTIWKDQYQKDRAVLGADLS